MQLKPVLRGVRVVAFLLVFMNRLNKTKSAVFLYCSFSLFLKDPFSRLFTPHYGYKEILFSYKIMLQDF